jgi:hypothetical protein
VLLACSNGALYHRLPLFQTSQPLLHCLSRWMFPLCAALSSSTCLLASIAHVGAHYTPPPEPRYRPVRLFTPLVDRPRQHHHISVWLQGNRDKTHRHIHTHRRWLLPEALVLEMKRNIDVRGTHHRSIRE